MKTAMIMAALAALFLSATTQAESVEIYCYSGGQQVYHNPSVDIDDVEPGDGVLVITTEGQNVALMNVSCVVYERAEEEVK